MKPQWSLRRYKKGDEYGMAKLMQLEWGGNEDYWRELWMWECAKSPMGHLTTVAEHDGQIVGKMSLVLVRTNVGNETFVGSQAVELVVHPSFRRQGMFQAIGKHLLSEAGREGIPVSYGFPNKPAHSGHLKYGWFDVCNIPVFIKFLDTRKALRWYMVRKYDIIRVLNKSRIFRFALGYFLRAVAVGVDLILMTLRGVGRSFGPEKAKITRVHRFDQRFDDFWEDVSKYHGIIVVRDSNYLNWRYFEKPSSEYTVFAVEKNNKISGYVILRLGEASGTIIDILACPDKSVIGYLLSETTQYLKRKKANWVTCVMLPDELYYRALKENGFIPIASENPVIGRVNNTQVSESFVKDFRNWHISLGDSVNRVA